MGESCRQSEGTAGERPLTYTAETLALPSVNDQSWNARLYHDSQEMEACLQPVRIKTPAPSPAPFAGGEGGRGAYLDTDRNISPQLFEGRSIDGYERERKKKRFKHIANIAHALYHADEEQTGLRLLGCGYWFQRFNFGCGTYKLVPYPCDSIFCPECSARRSKPLQDRILARMDQKNCDYFFLTVTLKSMEELSREKIDRLIHTRAGIRIYIFSSKPNEGPLAYITLNDLRNAGSRSLGTVMCSILKKCTESLKKAGKLERSTLLLFVNWLSMRRSRQVFPIEEIRF